MTYTSHPCYRICRCLIQSCEGIYYRRDGFELALEVVQELCKLQLNNNHVEQDDGIEENATSQIQWKRVCVVLYLLLYRSVICQGPPVFVM